MRTFIGAMFLLAACGAKDGASRNLTPATPVVLTTQIDGQTGGTAPSPDTLFEVRFPAGALVGLYQVNVTEGAAVSPAPSATLSKMYRVSVAPAPAGQLSAELRFAVAATTVAQVAPSNLQVGWRSNETGPFAGFYDATYIASEDAVSATTKHFSDFCVVDMNALQNGGGSDGGPLGGDPTPGDPLPNACWSTGDCPAGQVCLSGACRTLCASDFDCGLGETCPAGICEPGASSAPAGWTCSSSFYAATDGCDCECGVYDPDCADPSATMFNCYGFTDPRCDLNGHCIEASAPTGPTGP